MTRFAYVFALTLAGCGGLFGEGKPSTSKPSGDPLVAASDPGIVQLEGATGNEYLPAGASAEMIARVRITTKPVAGGERPPINLVLVVDTSGSMEGDPIANARAAAQSVVDELEVGDQLAVIAFHSQTEVLVPTTALTGESIAAVKADIEQMQARGTTDMAGGLAAAVQQGAAGRKPDGVNRIVLLSDGVPNDETQIIPIAQNARNAGFSITALGLGVDYNETLLANVAQLSGGKFHYIEDSAEVAQVFRDEVLRLERVVARNANLTFVPGPGVTIVEVVGQQAQPAGNGRSMQLHIGDISEGDQRDIVLRLQVEGRRADAAVELMDAVLWFQDTVANAGNLERRVYLAARATADAARVEAGRDPEIERALERARAAAATVQAIALARSGRADEGQQLLDTAESQARAAAARFDDEQLAGQADSMVELRGALPSLAAAPAPNAVEIDEAAAEAAPAVIRSTHDRAMETLQGD